MSIDLKEGLLKVYGFLKDSYERATDWDEVAKNFNNDPYDNLGLGFEEPLVMNYQENMATEQEDLEDEKR